MEPPPTATSASPTRSAWRAALGVLVPLAWAAVALLAFDLAAKSFAFSGHVVLELASLVAAGVVAVLLARFARGPFTPRASRWRSRIALALGATLVTLGVLEVVARLVDPLGISYYPATARYGRLMRRDRDTGYGHTPGTHTTLQGVAVDVEEHGLRERPIAAKAENEFRVLVVGDSVTFGWGVRAEDTFCRRIEPLLAAGTRRTVRTINSGVGGYDTDQERAFLEREGDGLSPDLVLLVFVHNDVDGAVPGAAREPDEWPLVDVGALFRGLYLGCLAQFVADLHRAAPEVATRESAGWKRSMASVGAIADWCRARRLPLVTFLYRREDSAKYAALREDLKPVVEQRGFAFVDVGPWFDGQPRQRVCNSVVDPHPNAEGHRIVAEGIARTLLTLRQVPP